MLDVSADRLDDASKQIPYYNNLRYVIAKKKVEDLFLKWISMPKTEELFKDLLVSAKAHEIKDLAGPNPLFTQKMVQSPTIAHVNIMKSPNTPPKSPVDLKRKSTELFSPSGISPAKRFGNKLTLSLMDPNKIIPQFFFPKKNVDTNYSNEKIYKIIINEIFKKDEIDLKGCKDLCLDLFGLPKFFAPIIFNKLSENKGKAVAKAYFLNLWKKELETMNELEWTFYFLKQSNDRNYLTPQDFQPVLRELLENHPGLEFLKATPEFQDRFAETVVYRIFFINDRTNTGKITFRDFKRSNLLKIFQQLETEEDINKIRDYFSYEHFYVLYCRFWELDIDHDFIINKEEFSRYSGHALSGKVVDRIFTQIPRKFKCEIAGKMNYEDFVYFMLSEEDKTTEASIEFWFKVVDLDENGIISGWEMDYFYEEQKQRLDYLNHEPVFFQDMLCQMVDLLKPEENIKFRISNFKKNKKVCGIFFNFLTNLNKLVAYEQRDPFMIRNENTEYPDYTDWDKFAQSEYLRLAIEEENPENAEVNELFGGENFEEEV